MTRSSLLRAAPFTLLTLSACISSRQTLTPQAAQVKYVQSKDEPPCDMLSEVTVGRDWFVTDERQPAVSKDDVVVRMRRLAAKAGGNYVVILENEEPNSQCSGFNGLGRIYRCSSTVLASLPSDGSREVAQSAE